MQMVLRSAVVRALLQTMGDPHRHLQPSKVCEQGVTWRFPCKSAATAEVTNETGDK